MKLHSSRVYIRPLEVTDTEHLVQLLLRNRDFFQQYDPIRPESYYCTEVQTEQIISATKSLEDGSGYAFGIFLEGDHTLMGRVSLSAVSRGPFQNAYLGYYLDQQYNGKGYTTEAIQLILQYCFQKIDLHRIQAGVMPRNTASIRVLEKNGFRREGLAERYLRINGQWEDHLLYAITQEEFSITSVL
ncbi:GNAT family N-acetyltransferase [Thermoactinomyces sp. DSM 45892]|uniref:GNAT family N-acetyltransferase n=1 Tax=Thermoactinomyces sp. DSM 45892 TaxID=1882753 RepID=UPI000899BC13|nr:GNAT family protein [Thermoactinomyces sp. DSM 45892]SDY53674.1 ribosomal-protein-alanine N-acetyltransferase [Thermoactinomyces sp. DSM 45892]